MFWETQGIFWIPKVFLAILRGGGKPIYLENANVFWESIFGKPS